MDSVTWFTFADLLLWTDCYMPQTQGMHTYYTWNKLPWLSLDLNDKIHDNFTCAKLKSNNLPSNICSKNNLNYNWPTPLITWVSSNKQVIYTVEFPRILNTASMTCPWCTNIRTSGLFFHNIQSLEKMTTPGFNTRRIQSNADQQHLLPHRFHLRNISKEKITHTQLKQ